MGFFVVLLLAGLLVILFFKARKIVKEGERLVVLRFGRFFDLRGPGLHLVLPFVDETRLVDLQSEVPEWRGLSETELGDHVVRKAVGQPALDEWVKNERKPLVPKKR